MVVYDITIQEGETFSLTFEFFNREVVETTTPTGTLVKDYTDSPKNLVGKTIIARIKSSYLESAPVLATFSTNVSNTNKLTISLTSTQTDNLIDTITRDTLLGYYDVFSVDGTVREKLLMGSVNYIQSVSI